MNINFTRFSIIGLHGKYDIEIPIFDNKIILIGVNGLGKTTVINFIYFVLTDQWSRLMDYDFSAIELTLNGREIVISRGDIASKIGAQRRHNRLVARYSYKSPYPRSVVSKIFSHPLFRHLRNKSDFPMEGVLHKIAEDTGVSALMIRRMIADFPSDAQEELFSEFHEPRCFTELSEILENGGIKQVIYMPTYRRIEQDIKAIFPLASEEELKKLATSMGVINKSGPRGYVELVQFGMQDVETILATELGLIENKTREQLTGLTASYLQDIIRSRADTIEPSVIASMTDPVVERVLKRVEENTLSAEDKSAIQNSIRRMRAGDGAPAVARDLYLTYFFSRLLEIYTDLYRREEAIRRLEETCNSYLVGKKLRYNDGNFTARVFDRDGAELSWRALSSGEKQVASLFTHLYLSRETSQIVLIDEPELSLSVRWQKNLLPDILNSGNCDLLVAVTHSPFIYTNSLRGHAVDLAKLIKPHTSKS
ncbi:AAA family ATPase [Paraburkholderia nodosa]|uniref:AAA family ATPase n=1 Tax=Paraburkholderia nodosa TaxID=392320 RepID=UPI0009F1D087|nr:AAA family ATPase [Paraburkholderia nodosa]